MSKPKKEKWFINQLHDIIKEVGFKKLGIFPRTLDFLLAIAKYADKKGYCYPTQSQLENYCGIRSKDQHRHIQILEKREFLTKTRTYDRRNHMTRNYYTIHLNAILTISIGSEGDLRVDGIAVSPTNTVPEDACSNIEPNRMVRDDQTRMVRFATIKTTHTTKQPMRTANRPNAVQFGQYL